MSDTDPRETEDTTDETIDVEDEITVEEIQAYQRFGALVILGGLLVVFIVMSIQAWFASQSM